MITVLIVLDLLKINVLAVVSTSICHMIQHLQAMAFAWQRKVEDQLSLIFMFMLKRKVTQGLLGS